MVITLKLLMLIGNVVLRVFTKTLNVCVLVNIGTKLWNRTFLPGKFGTACTPDIRHVVLLVLIPPKFEMATLDVVTIAALPHSGPWYPEPQALCVKKNGENSKNETPVAQKLKKLTASSSANGSSNNTGTSRGSPSCADDRSSAGSAPSGQWTVASTDSTTTYARWMDTPMVDGAEVEM